MDLRIRNLVSSIKNLVILIEIAFNSQVKIESLCSDFDIFSISSCLHLCPVVKAYGFLHIRISLLSVRLLLNIGHPPTHTHIHVLDTLTFQLVACVQKSYFFYCDLVSEQPIKLF